MYYGTSSNDQIEISDQLPAVSPATSFSDFSTFEISAARCTSDLFAAIHLSGRRWRYLSQELSSLEMV